MFQRRRERSFSKERKRDFTSLIKFIVPPIGMVIYSTNGIMLVIGNYNAKVENDKDQQQVTGPYSQHNKSNNNSNIFVEFAEEQFIYRKHIVLL